MAGRPGEKRAGLREIGWLVDCGFTPQRNYGYPRCHEVGLWIIWLTWGAPAAPHGVTSLAEDGVCCIAYLPNITSVLRLGLIKPTNSSSAGQRATEPLRPENAKLVVGEGYILKVHFVVYIGIISKLGVREHDTT